MIFPGHGVLSKIIIVMLFVTTTLSEDPVSNSRSYDTSDWIPVNRPTASVEGNQAENTQKRPTGRVLNLPSQDGKQYFPSNQQVVSSQNYRLPPESARNQQTRLLQSQRQYQTQPTYVPNGPQQILLPPQLQSLISQGHSYIAPQKINQQLLPTQSHELVTLPAQHISLNSTNYATESIQNLRPYNQQYEQQVPKQTIHQSEQPEVQLLYVPLENLQQQTDQKQQQIVFPTEQTVNIPQIYKSLSQQQYHSPVQHKQAQLQNIEQEFVQQALQAQKLNEQFQQNVQPIQQQSYRRPSTDIHSQSQTSPTTKKRKPHQPPLAVYMGTEGQQDIKIKDVLTLLKDARTISVQDTIGPDSPQVFVGPSHLEAPEGYAKFDLPYLSSIENNRVERKVDHLPFFVAPLSYKAPPGYSKIPFPAPHVGSVVINHLKASSSTSPSFQTLEETSSQIPLSQTEISTVRSTRGRQRQPSRTNHSPNSAHNTGSVDIPYGPLETRVPEIKQSHSIQESLISTNPYGPTSYIQTTTPVNYEKNAAFPAEIFSTRNRFSTTSAYDRHNFQNNGRIKEESTESTLSSSTLSETLTNDKYTVLEQFPIGGKHKVKETDPNTSHRGISREQLRRPIDDTYHTDSVEKTAAPVISNIPYDLDNKSFNRQSNSQRQTSTRQREVENQEDNHRRQVHGDKSRQSTTENYQEIPSRPRVTANYNALHQVTHNSPVQLAFLKEEAPAQQSNEEYEVPHRHVTQQSQIREHQQPLSQNYYEDQLPPYKNSQTQKTRGQQHYAPDIYSQAKYEQLSKEKTTESLITVTKEPVFEYKIPNEDVSYPHLQNHHQQQIPDAYYQDEAQHDSIPSKQEYTLPDKLPPISPQLPGLINSLQDQQIRPLLAPLLIPPSEQPPTNTIKYENPDEYNQSAAPVYLPISTTTSKSTTTTTAPVTETAQFKRTRTRQRGTRPTVSHDYISTTVAPQRSSQYRGRRPSSPQLRHHSSSSHPDVDTESITRATVYKNRYPTQTTEQPRRSSTTPRQRFRTRGRPVKAEGEYVEKTAPEQAPLYQELTSEIGYQSSTPVSQSNINLEENQSTNFEGRVEINQKPKKEQALIYIQSTSKPDARQNSQVPDLYIPRQQFISSTESHEFIHEPTIATTGPESNLVPDVAHDQPNIMTAQNHYKLSPTELDASSQEKYSSESEISVQIPENRYNTNLDNKEQITTESTRTKSRTRGKTRGRVVNPVVGTSRYQSPLPTTTTQKTTNDEEAEEFYGFFRKPNFGRPAQAEKTDSVIIPSTSTPSHKNNDYSSRTTEGSYYKRLHSNSDDIPVSSSPKSYLPETRYDDSYYEPNIQVQRQYISSTNTPLEDSISDIKHVTRRPSVRTRRPITSPTRSSESVSVSSEQSSERYSHRTSKRPEAQTARPTRIRGRIRIPTRSSSAEASNSDTHSSSSNELVNGNVTPVRTSTRQRITNRGKSHFQLPKTEKVTEEPEEENYPVSFLQGHGIQRQSSTVGYSTPAASSLQSVILSTPDSLTPRPSFQITIEPADTEAEYSDQVPYSSGHQPQVTSRDLEQGGEESQFSAKFIDKPLNFNYIVSEEKTTTAKIAELQTPVSESITTMESSSTSEVNTNYYQETTSKSTEDTVTNSETTTDVSLTTTEYVTQNVKSRRRGVWRLVNTRPIGDDFESAESQNIHSVFDDNDFSKTEKPIKRYKIVQRIRTTTEPSSHETTTINLSETISSSHNENTTHETEKLSTTESSILAPLYEMFGFNAEKHLENDNVGNVQYDGFITENPTTIHGLSDNMETTTTQNNNISVTIPMNDDKIGTYSDIVQDIESSTSSKTWQSKVIGTSTSTEVSHETEICYRGRCVKSASTEESSEERF